MLDFSKIFNIIFASVCAALLLLFLISVIVVAAKGKRKCGVGDVLLRIVATLVFIASAAMVACSVLTMIKGDVAILVSENGEAAVLVLNTSVTELPLPELFAALSTVIGFGLSAILFIMSLTALIVDCLVANKKEGKKNEKKKKEPAVKKSPEQLKREAELERIRRIGESAVRKTERVAKTEKTEKTEKVENSETTKDEVAEESIPTEQPQDDEPAVDWRSQPAEEQHSGFVGLKEDNADDSFDTFDTFDGEDETTADETDDYEQTEEVTDSVEEQQTDEYAEENGDEYAAEDDEYTDEQTEGGEQATEDIYYDDDAGYTYDDGAVEGEEVYEQAELDQTADGEYEGEDEQLDEYAEADEQPADEFGEVADEQPTDEDEQPIDIGQEVERILETPTDDIEPDRDIYIPEIRTVTPRPTEATTAAQKPVTQKPAAAKRPTTKPAKPKKNDGGASQRPVIPPEKKLPVTRRYVILDRHNAVNMFGEYLKERNQAEKDKLKSSINTIIIE